MQTVSPQSATVATAPITPPIENDACLSRTTKIALAVFTSLAAFVFLPLNAAIALSAVVTLGAIISSCGSQGQAPSPPTTNKNEEAKGSPSSSPVRPAAAARPLNPLFAPAQICIHNGKDGSLNSSKTVAINFQTPNAKMNFVTNHRDKFAEFAWVKTLSDYPTIVRIEIKSNEENKDAFSERTLETLQGIFRDEISERILTRFHNNSR